MIGVQMADQDRGKVGKLRLGLAEADIGAAGADLQCTQAK
jgi:hypothetical protein